MNPFNGIIYIGIIKAQRSQVGFEPMPFGTDHMVETDALPTASNVRTISLGETLVLIQIKTLEIVALES